ncbi:glycoside hydrolase family 130 protein [Olivibacter sitiensis]|uniref:glycoside hydrolase family 130 protein n=1 Tax=Olivibacter sitiensis TaxID=376470 RepID=UPI00041FAEFF|nr:glycoside hydrolase family 130 protein [Olivibacter sitiensis]
MRLSIERKPVKVYPDPKRVIARFFYNGDERAQTVVRHVLALNKAQIFGLISPLLQEFSKRHRNITKILMRHCKRVKSAIVAAGSDFDQLDDYTKLLIGSYFTHEYSIESAAFFNPSIIADPDQSELEEGMLRVILSFRAVGEGHISSLVFRRALINRHNDITVLPSGNYVDEADTIRNAVYDKKLFLRKATDANVCEVILREMEDKLEERFEYANLREVIVAFRERYAEDEKLLKESNLILALSDSYREIIFSKDTDISDRVIFPISEFERKGIEDARFVRFEKENGGVTYYATYTAFDGEHIMPKLLKTKDFYSFKVSPLHGLGAKNKNMALFPRKINGKYVMMSRYDGVSNYLMYSDKLNVWENPIKLQDPIEPWEFVQMGNCGSPIETDDGWLIITHAVGPMRRYCIGAALLDKENPEKEIGRLKEPLIIPNPDEREGYVPNVLYSCGSIINNGELIVPYGLSDHSSSFATVTLKMLLSKLTASEH